jgi:glyoxylase-like metal-dependent hydrolase (beta-lactamase superfamily II)
MLWQHVPVRIETLDLRFQGTAHVIASFLIHGPDGPVLIETGPGSTLPTLLEELGRRDLRPGEIRHVLVTHIHLDHAGAAGWWARQGARIHVHPAGAPHLIEPGKLLASARRIYGEAMDALWGEVLSAPAESVVAVEDGTIIEASGMSIEAIATPGHAGHHHVFRWGEVAFSGDAAGIRLPGLGWIDLPAPPPEFDLEAWRASLARLREAGLRTLYRTHFGPGTDARQELDQFEELLERGAGWIREMLEQGLDRDAMVERFGKRMRSRAVEIGVGEAALGAYELANPRSMSVDGIARYWRKRRAG